MNCLAQFKRHTTQEAMINFHHALFIFLFYDSVTCQSQSTLSQTQYGALAAVRATLASPFEGFGSTNACPEAIVDVVECANKNVVSLKIGSQELGQLPAALFQLTALTLLSVDQGFLLFCILLTRAFFICRWLHQNSLTKISSEIGKLKELRHLRLDSNNIAELPTQIGQLGQLGDLCVCLFCFGGSI